MSEKKPCGPDWMPTVMKPKSIFKDACKVHDNDYAAGKNRKQADVEFYERMITTKNTTKYQQAVGLLYYGLVRVFGWLSWRKANKNGHR